MHADSSRSHLLKQRLSPAVAERPSSLNPSVPRDLETIVLKATSLEAADRYQTAAELADDLDNFLADRPIRARPPSTFHRLLKWCRRNPAVASLTGLATVLLLLVAITASIGYARTNAALRRESAQRAQVEIEKQRAETTLGISLNALDRVYQRFAPDRIAQPASLTIEGADGEELTLASQPVLSNDTAALLTELLAFYDQFTGSETNSQALQREAAKASRRVGDIHQRLGAFKIAEDAYLSAIKRYEALLPTHDSGPIDALTSSELTINIARIHNELGNVFLARREPERAHRSHQTAFELLEPLSRRLREPPDSNQPWVDSAELNFELARSLYLLDKRLPPDPGTGPPQPPGHHRAGHGRPGKGRSLGAGLLGSLGPVLGWKPEHQHLNQAIDLLTELATEQANQPAYQLWLAICYRERSRGRRTADLQTAIEILKRLAAQYPGIADYRFELSQTLAQVTIRRPGSPGQGDLKEIEPQLREALELVDDLVVEHPNIPDYAYAQTQSLEKLGSLLLRRASLAKANSRAALLSESQQLIERSVARLEQLHHMFPDRVSDLVWLAHGQRCLGEVFVEQRNWLDAKQAIQASIDYLELALIGEPDMRFIHQSLHQQYRELAGVLLRLNQTDAADAARTKSHAHRPRTGPGMFVPPNLLDHESDSRGRRQPPGGPR